MSGKKRRSGRRPYDAQQRAFYQRLGERVRLARTRAALRQQDLAALVGLTHSTLCKIETGATGLPAHYVPGLAGALGVTMSWLLTGAER